MFRTHEKREKSVLVFFLLLQVCFSFKKHLSVHTSMARKGEGEKALTAFTLPPSAILSAAEVQVSPNAEEYRKTPLKIKKCSLACNEVPSSFSLAFVKFLFLLLPPHPSKEGPFPVPAGEGSKRRLRRRRRRRRRQSHHAQSPSSPV